MAKRKRPEEKEEINMTPMLDIVFIMLIFFIVTATFVKETGIDVTKPPSERSIEIELANILIAVSEDGEVWVEGREIEMGAVQSVLTRLFAENPKGSLSIQVDEDAPGYYVVSIVEAAKAAGIPNISLSTERM